uniref:Uncharacterized protein n=1 Tax=Trichuris muris TaxID=70415 RepID=A0A5S6PYJ2_TRIMR
MNSAEDAGQKSDAKTNRKEETGETKRVDIKEPSETSEKKLTTAEQSSTDEQKKHEQECDAMPPIEQCVAKKFSAIAMKRIKRKDQPGRRPLRRSKSLTDITVPKRFKKSEISAIHTYSMGTSRIYRKGKRAKSQLEIITTNVKTIDMEMPPTEEEKNSWSEARSLRSENSESCGVHKTEVTLTADNAYRKTTRTGGQRIKLEPVKLAGGWYKEIYRFHVNRLQDVSRLVRKKRHVSKFPMIQRLMLEAIHLPPVGSEKREDDTAEYVNVFIKAPPPAVATDPEKQILLKQLVTMVSLAFRTFSCLISQRNNFFKLCRRDREKSGTVGRFLAELLVTLKNILDDTESYADEESDMSLERAPHRLSTELERIIQVVDFIQDSSLFQGPEENPMEPSRTNVMQSGNYYQMQRLMDSFKRMRLYAASMLLRLPTKLADVELHANKTLMKAPVCSTLQVPANWVQEVYTCGTNAKCTNAVAIQINEQDSVKESNTLSVPYVNFDMDEWGKPREAIVHSSKTKAIFYVCEPEDNVRSVQIIAGHLSQKGRLPLESDAECANGTPVSKGTAAKTQGLTTADQGNDDEIEYSGDEQEPPVATAVADGLSEATLVFSKNQQSHTPPSDQSGTPKTGPSTPVFTMDGKDSKQSTPAAAAQLPDKLARTSSPYGNSKSAGEQAGPAAALQRRLRPQGEGKPFLELPSPMSDTVALTSGGAPIDVYKWAKSTTEKFATIKECDPDKQRSLCQTFFEEQVRLKQSLHFEQSRNEPTKKDEQQRSSSKGDELNEWDDLVKEWKRTSVERWNRYGIRLKIDDKDQTELEKQMQAASKGDASLCSRIFSMAYNALFKAPNVQKVRTDKDRPDKKAPKDTAAPKKETPAPPEHEVKRFINSLTILASTQFPTNADQIPKNKEEGAADKRKSVAKSSAQKSKKL